LRKRKEDAILIKVKKDKEECSDETCENIEYTDSEQYSKEGRMRRMPDILSVSMQDFLYSRKSDLRTQQIRDICKLKNQETAVLKGSLSLFCCQITIKILKR